MRRSKRTIQRQALPVTITSGLVSGPALALALAFGLGFGFGLGPGCNKKRGQTKTTACKDDLPRILVPEHDEEAALASRACRQDGDCVNTHLNDGSCCTGSWKTTYNKSFAAQLEKRHKQCCKPQKDYDCPHKKTKRRVGHYRLTCTEGQCEEVLVPKAPNAPNAAPTAKPARPAKPAT